MSTLSRPIRIMKFILGKKGGMTQLYREDGSVIPVTVIEAPDAFVTQIKDSERDGYKAVQISSGEQKESRIAKPQRGHFKKLGNFRDSVEIRYKDNENIEYKVGDKIEVSVFEPDDKVQISGISKGKGFQGVVKRHSFAGGPKSHGHRHDQRKPGSIGATGPARVFKGTRMAGRMGGNRITVKNLKVISVDPKAKLLFVKGAVPGRRGTSLEIIAK